MSKTDDIRNSILEAIDTIAQRRIDQLQLDKTIVAIINSKVGVANKRNIYKVEYEGGFFNATAQNENDAYLPRMAVYVQVPQGDFSKEKFILGQASKLATNEQISVVSALSNNYGIIGKNILENNAQKVGLYSYHSPTEESIDGNKINKIDHRYNFLYGGDTESELTPALGELSLYKKDAQAVMFRADFMTQLTTEQQNRATGEYGLVFNLVFKNLASGIGDTQGAIFDYYKEKIAANSTSLKTCDEQLISIIKNNSVGNLIKSDGKFDELISQIQELERVFKNNKKVEYTAEVEDLISKYITMINNMRTASTTQNMLDSRLEWRNVQIGEPAEKNVSYYLSSNDMIGNPFSFSSWMSQYGVFEIDLENLLRIDSILFYKEGFIEDSVKESTWREGDPDIWVRNVQMYLMKPISEISSGYQLKVEATDTGMIFDSEDDDQEIIAEATFLKQYYEDLTKNSKTKIYWFKQSDSVTSPANANYNIYGGIGWKEIQNNYSYQLTLTAKDNLCYENHYRCTVVYLGEETPIILRYDFIVYNNGGQVFTLESDLGTNFTFDAGIPTLTIYKEEDEELVEIIDSPLYNFKWALIDGNNQKVFLDEINKLDLTNISISTYNNYTNSSKLLKNIKWYCGDRDITSASNKSKATRIKYPMSNIGTAANVTFECYIEYRKKETDSFSSIGKTSITLENFKSLSPSDFRIFIENGDQVFQYDEYGNAPNAAKYKDPQEILPLRVHLFAPNNIEIQNTSYRVKWYLPTSDTLLQYSNAKIDPATSIANMYEGNELVFDIKSLYDYNSIDNQIRCQVDFNDTTRYANTNLTFTKVGNNGTNGTDVVAKIIPRVENTIYAEQPLTLYYGTDNKILFTGSNVAKDIPFNLTDNNGIVIPKLYQKNQEVNPDSIRWNIAGNTSTASNKYGHNIQIIDNNLIWTTGAKQYRQNILKAELKYESKSYYAFFNLPYIRYNSAVPRFDSNRIAIKNNTYLKEIIYNADGRDPLYNHNQGLELINLPKNYRIDWRAKGGYVTNETKPNFSLLLEKNGSPKTTISNSTQTKVFVLPNDEFNGSVTNNYIEAIIYSNNTLFATVCAPISMSLNTFGLASLNAWDGNSITIDEDEGYIMAPQIGAGYKDTSTNLFTGVVMGQADDYSSGEEHLYTGLLGYKNGMRSFFIDAETGDATFGYPSLNTDEKKVRKFINGKWVEIDNYNEGEIQLRPGDVSIIGGWRLGRRSLFYSINNDNDQVENTLGNAYSVDGTDHTKDIAGGSRGILLSADKPYIYVKSRTITDDDLSGGDASVSQIKEGDSIGVQLDPQNYRAFGIYRHYKENNNWTRVLLSGINNQGELVANKVQSAPSSSTNPTTTTMGVNLLKAFGSPNPTYVGLNLSVSKGRGIDQIGTSFFKAFIDNTDNNTSGQLYITAGYNNNSDYVRPISIHGKSIDLYADNNNSHAKTSDSYIKISENNFSGKVGNTNIDFNRSTASSITTFEAFTINSGLSSARKNFTLSSAAQTFSASGAIGINSGGTYTINSVGAININTTGNNNIKLTRQNGSNVELQTEWTYLRTGNNNNNMLAITNNTGQTTQLKSDAAISVTSNKRLTLTGKGNNDAGDYGIILISNDTANKSVSLKLRPHYSGGSSHPFDLALGNAGNVWVEFEPSNSIAKWYTGMNQEIAMGLKINGNFLGNDYGLKVDNNITCDNNINAATFSGDGSNISNTAGGTGISGGDVIVEGVGGSDWITVPLIDLTNGRPFFGTRTLTVNMPTSWEIWNAISGEVSSAINSALSNYVTESELNDYAKSSDLDNYLKKDVNYTINNPDGGYVRNVVYNSEGKVTGVDKSVTFSAS